MYQVRYVLAAAEHLNFTRAAASCHVSQPALTKGIKTLEAELDGPLFHREGRSIILSQLGRALLPHLREILAEAMAVQSLAQDFNQLSAMPVRIGVQSTIGPVRFGRFFDAVETAHPEVELAISMGNTEVVTKSLQQDELDVAILTRLPQHENRLTLLPLYRERYVVVLPPGHALAARESLSLQDLSGETYVDRLQCEMREAVMAECSTRSVKLHPRFRAQRDDWVQGMVVSGLGFAFLPEHSVTQAGMVVRPLADPVVEREICLASIPGRPFASGAAALVRLAQTFLWQH